MKNSKEIASTVFKVRDEYIKQQQIRLKRIGKASAVCGTVCALCLTIAGAGYFNSVQNELPSVTMEAETSDAQVQKIMPEENIEATAETTLAVSFDDKTEAETAVMTSAKTGTQSGSHIIEVQTETKEAVIAPFPTDAPVIESTEETSSVTDEVFEEPKWDERTISEQFAEFTADGTVYVTKCADISDENIGEKLYDTVITGYDFYTEETHHADVSVYRIIGVSTECAVSVRFPGYDTGYVYTNRRYFPETLGEMMDDMNLEETVSFHTLYTAEDRTCITDYDRSLLMNLLNEHRSCSTATDDTYHKPLFSVSTNVDMLGITNKSMKVTKDGYLITNIMEWGYTFFIGVDKAASLAQAFGIEETDTSTVNKPDAIIQTTPANEDLVYE